MTEDQQQTPPPASAASQTPAPAARGRSPWFYVALATVTMISLMLITAFGTAWWIRRQLHPPAIKKVELTQDETKVLEKKLETLGAGDRRLDPESPVGGGITVDPPRPSLTITERELNGMLGHNTNLAGKVELKLDHDAVRALTNIPVPPDFPVLGGKTIRLNVSMQALLVDKRLSLTVADISLGGFPLPNAWLGGIKGVDLIERYADRGPLRAFAAGIAELHIDNGKLTLVPAD